VLVAWRELAEAVAQAEIEKTQGRPVADIQDKWVDSDYPTQLGITKRLEAYTGEPNGAASAIDSRLSREGWPAA
jgi:hypothetical protein